MSLMEPNAREPLNALNKKIRTALDLYPDLRKKALKVATIHAAGELTNGVLNDLLDIIMANKVARPTRRRLTWRLLEPLTRLLDKSQRIPGHYCHVTEFADLHATDFNFCRFWGLVEKDPKRRGYWRLTRLFIYFMMGYVNVPSEIIFNGGGAKVKYSPGPDRVSVADLVPEDVRNRRKRELNYWWTYGGKLDLTLTSPDWCGGFDCPGLLDGSLNRAQAAFVPDLWAIHDADPANPALK